MSTVPPWGCPWHGLVVNEQLELSTGEFLPWSLGQALPVQIGTACEIRVPGLPLPETTEADALAGRLWRNTALLAGCSLHGRALPFNAWIYIAPDSSPWLVKPTFSPALGLPTSGSIRIERFGVLGGAPEIYEYSLSLPDFEQSGDGPAVTGVCRHHVKPDGSGALFMIYNSPSSGDSSAPQTWTHPLGFFEIRLSGAPSELTITLETLRSRDETISSPVEVVNNPPLVGLVQELVSETEYEGEEYPVCNGTFEVRNDLVIRAADEDDPPAIIEEFRVGAGSRTVEHPGYIVSLFYGSDGGIHEVSAGQSFASNWNADAPTVAQLQPQIDSYGATPNDVTGACMAIGIVPVQPIRFRIEQTSTFAATARQFYLLDGEEVVSRTVEYEDTQWGATRNDPDVPWPAWLGYVPPEYQTARSTRQQYPNVDETYQEGVSLSRTNWPPMFGVGMFALTSAEETVRLLTMPAFISRANDFLEGEATHYIDNWMYGFAQYSGVMFGWLDHAQYTRKVVPRSPYYKITAANTAFTPGGEATLAPVAEQTWNPGNAGYPPFYGSWNPLSGEAARSEYSLCWT